MDPQLLGDRPVSRIRLADDEGPGRILVDPVNDTGPHDPVDPRQIAPAVGQDRVYEGSGHIPGCGVNDHSLGLVDDEDVRILIDDIKRDVLRLHGELLRSGDPDDKFLSGFHFPAALDGLAGNRSASPGD